jgi:hypothetical protein
MQGDFLGPEGATPTLGIGEKNYSASNRSPFQRGKEEAGFLGPNGQRLLSYGFLSPMVSPVF